MRTVKSFSELRNFEARRFAVKLKVALENTNRVGAVELLQIQVHRVKFMF